ncbi:MAG TPA: FtsQ-type POTRA domain-containing protein [Vicinamibacterales bacterium]|nr:FtsQ-type POTRA domain-containing protein [Vicinamibacterales bacterium]
MEKVLARREVNRTILQQYILDETERVEVLGPGKVPLFRQHREFTWYVRDGLHVRSPVRFDGVAVGERDRDKYEEDWTRRERRRLERQKERDRREGHPPEDPDPAPAPGGATPIPTPRFVSEAYFMDFKFEPGNYYLAGRERLEGIEVLRIEYYPQQMFGDEHDHEPSERQQRRNERRRERETEDRINRQMNKTSLITLWVDPAEHQIVKYTFDNVWLDFLPGAWLVRVDDLSASMTMGQPFPGIWLPRDLDVHGGVTLASGSLEAAYSRVFAEYRQAEVKTKLRIPKGGGSPDAEPPDGSGPFVADETVSRSQDLPNPSDDAAPRDQQRETIAEIRVHGNAFIPDADIIALAGIVLAQPLGSDTLTEVESRLRRSGRFESVEVRKRYRSLTDTTEVAVLILVHERTGVDSIEDDVGPVSGGWRRLKSRLMFLPILDYADGYGFTYGGRVSTVGLLGIGERLSVPLTWGGTRQAVVEFERVFESGPLTRIESSGGMWQRENPHFRLDDRRVEVRARAERQFARVLRAGADVSHSDVDFGASDARLWIAGADVMLDTRGDPGFPRNAVVLAAGWQGLYEDGRPDRIDRYTADARGYLGLFRQIVLAGRVLYVGADATLPDYERLLLGGSSTLRGFRTGTFASDRRLNASAELRVPLTSVLSVARLGVTAFFDAGKAYDVGERFEDADWHRGAGAGVFLMASIVRINLDVAHGLKDGDTRVHLSTGFAF